MEADVREALRHLITAFENHLEAVASRRSPDDAAVDDAYEALAAAFERYEEQLDLEFAEGLPLVLEDDDADDDFEYDEADEDADEAGDADGDDLVEDELADDDLADDDEDEDAEDLDEFDLRD